MDKVDIGVLRWFFQGQQAAPFRPEVRPMVRALAEQLGVSDETIRNRVRRLFKIGALKGVVLQPHPAVLGASAGALGFFVQNGTSRQAIARKLALVEGMQVVATHLDGMVGAVFIHDGAASLKRKVDLIKELGGASESFYTEIAFPPCTLKLSRTDWRIMAALRPDATKSYGTLANELGLSRKTVKRRLDRMVAGNAVFTMAAHEVRNAESPEANMAVFYEDSADRSKTDPEILRVLADHLLYAGIWPGYSVYAVAIPNVARGDELAARVRGVEGVRDARSSIIDERVELFESLDGMIAKNL